MRFHMSHKCRTLLSFHNCPCLFRGAEGFLPPRTLLLHLTALPTLASGTPDLCHHGCTVRYQISKIRVGIRPYTYVLEYAYSEQLRFLNP
jgi:hypothetical protein